MVYRIGTRGSDLALWQARQAAERLAAPAELVIIRTQGDRRQEIALQGGSTTGFFTRELEQALLAGEIDLAVHSLKDLPTRCADGLRIAAVLPRGAVSDLLLLGGVAALADSSSGRLPVGAGAVVGAGSLRRQALLACFAPGSEARLLRGNVPTRLEKCRSGQYQAIVIARAGVERLALDPAPLRACELNPEQWLPAPGQGAVAVQVRQRDLELAGLAALMNDEPTEQAVTLERKLLALFEGGCHTAFGAWARPWRGQWRVDFGIAREPGGWKALTVVGTLAELNRIEPGCEEKMVPPVGNEELWWSWQR